MRNTVSMSTCLFALLASAQAQSTLQWQPGSAIPGPIDGYGLALVGWDPDGSGPLPERMVVGGSFFDASGQDLGTVLAFDPAGVSWTSVSLDNSTVRQLVVLPSGDLVAAGTLFLPGTTTNIGIAFWDGQGWQALGGGRSRTVSVVTLMANGDLVAGGEALEVWDGSAWSVIPTPIANASSYLPLALSNGDLAVAFATPTGAFLGVRSAAGWQTWGAFSTPPIGSFVYSMAALPNGDFVVGGVFEAVGGVASPDLIRFHQGAWVPLPRPGTHRVPVRLFARPDGSVLMANYAASVLRWDGTDWISFGSPLSQIGAFGETSTGELFVAGGYSHDLDGVVRRYDSGAWRPLGHGFTSPILDLEVDARGDLFVAGEFDQAGDTAAFAVARRDAAGWHALGAGPRSPAQTVLPLTNGNVVTGTSHGDVELWDGAQWRTIGDLGYYAVKALIELPNGDVVAGGRFSATARRVARWDGSAWHALGTGLGPPFNGGEYDSVECLLAMPNGDVIAGGYFKDPNNNNQLWNIARWDGNSWAAVGPGIGSGNRVVDLALAPDGSLLAAVRGGYNPGIRRWDGTAWSAFAVVNDNIFAIDVLPNGDLLAGGSFTQIAGVAVAGLARWDGSVWAAVDPSVGPVVEALAHTPDGTVHAATHIGAFCCRLEIQGVITRHYATLTTQLQARADRIPTPCVGPAGPLELTAAALPWIGTTFRSTAAGFAPGALALAIAGTAPRNLPLSLVLPSALPGCHQLASSEVAAFAIPSAGAASFEFAIPNTIVLAQLQAWHQFLQLELTPQGVPLTLSSSNGLHLVIGAF